ITPIGCIKPGVHTRAPVFCLLLTGGGLRSRCRMHRKIVGNLAAMAEPLHPALLPLGLRDLLPPDAAAEALVVGRMMAVLESHGYQRVKPPLVEFEESLLSGPGAAMAQETF